MFRSIRWRLQAWHALILLLIVVGLGALLYAQVRASRFQEIDAELHAAARVLDGALRGFPPPVLEGWSDTPLGDDPRPPAGPREQDGESRGPRPPLSRERLERTLTLQPRRQPGDAETPLYAVIWLRNGDVLKNSHAAAETPAFASLPSVEQLQAGFHAQQRSAAREVIVLGPRQTRILTGRSIETELAALHHLAWHIGLTGVAVLAFGLAGGWFLSRRAVQPIATMSAAAAAISASNLSQRIDPTAMDQELGGLAGTLNAAFTRLEEAFEQQARFTADASHELRTPLAVIHSQIELALARPRSVEEYQETLQACLRAAQRMNGLIQGLLTLARADAEKQPMNYKRTSLAGIVQESVAQVTPLAAEKGVTISCSLTDHPVEADAERFVQVVTNLLSNAINYNHEGGKVSLTVTSDERDVLLSIADTGCGISEAERVHVFDRFYRVDKARSRASGGSGLGLAICKSIVEAHGGTITLSSELGVGSTLVVRLPRTTQARSDESSGEVAAGQTINSPSRCL